MSNTQNGYANTSNSIYGQVLESVITSQLDLSADNLLKKFYEILNNKGFAEEFGLAQETLEDKICPDAKYTAQETVNLLYAKMYLKEQGKNEHINTIGDENFTKIAQDEIQAISETDLEIIDIIGSKNLANPGMIAEKIRVMAKYHRSNDKHILFPKMRSVGGENWSNPSMTAEKITAIIDDMDLKVIKVIKGKNLAHPDMTIEKINAINKHMTVDEVKQVGSKTLLEATIFEIQTGTYGKSVEGLL